MTPPKQSARKRPDSSSVLAKPVLSPIDHQFAALMARLSGGDPEVKLAAALVSHSRSLGHICLDLRDAESPDSVAVAAELSCRLPEASRWLKQLRASRVVGTPGQFKPLILDEAGRLYLHRYWQYEAALGTALRRLAAEETAYDEIALKTGLQRLFPNGSTPQVDWQAVAAFAAMRKGLCVISGGPGTGKTRTVVFLLALLLETTRDQGQMAKWPPASDGKPAGTRCPDGAARLRIALAAPTGKAAARLQEAVKLAKAGLSCSDAVKAQLPDEAGTIHRLLGAIPESAYFRHHAENPLPFDVVVVDEASMVDLALMSKLVAALAPRARLILLGDKDQLASVQAGAVLADICGAGTARGFTAGFAAECARVAQQHLPSVSDRGRVALSDCVVELKKNYRFGEVSWIHRLSQAVNAGNSAGAQTILQDANVNTGCGISSRLLPAAGDLRAALKDLVVRELQPALKARDPVVALEQLARFKILCALRNGPYGVESLNDLVEEILAEAGLIQKTGLFYSGRPVMIRRNDYNLKLYNGDLGVLLPVAEGGELRAWFATAEGAARSYLPLRLPEHETAFALTVHKSQGSEFDRILLILPAEDSPVLTRELVYTGLTRASREVEIWYSAPTLAAAIDRKTARRSGLRDVLWGRGKNANG